MVVKGAHRRATARNHTSRESGGSVGYAERRSLAPLLQTHEHQAGHGADDDGVDEGSHHAHQTDLGMALPVWPAAWRCAGCAEAGLLRKDAA